MTPEGRVKAAVKRELDKYPHYREMPVPGGFGKSGLDFTVCIFGNFLAIETKRDGKEPTERQKLRMREIIDAGGLAVAVAGVDEVKTILKPLLEVLANDAGFRKPKTPGGGNTPAPCNPEPVPELQRDHPRRRAVSHRTARRGRDVHVAPSRLPGTGAHPDALRVAG